MTSGERFQDAVIVTFDAEGDSEVSGRSVLRGGAAQEMA